jgi:D-psicose/D-tagatose/L-ribulose 3-epimerase
MKYGMNLLLWTGEISDGLLPVLHMLKNYGYDSVEVPIFNTGLDYGKWSQKLDEIGLARTAVTIRGGDDNPISSDAANRQRGIDGNKKVLDCCAALGATKLVGPFHSAIGVFSGAGPTGDEWKWGVDSMRKTAEHAGKCGVTLGVECLNRFETYLLNSHADAARFCRQVAHPNCRMMYDTFHSNIEEKSIALALHSCADMLCHVHISENDRGTPGQGDVKWCETFEALHQIGYNDQLVVEAFGLALPEIAAATKIWRRMYESEEQLSRDALAFMKANVAKRWKS